MHIAIHCTIEFDLYGMGLAIVEEVHYLISLQSPQNHPPLHSHDGWFSITLSF